YWARLGFKLLENGLMVMDTTSTRPPMSQVLRKTKMPRCKRTKSVSYRVLVPTPKREPTAGTHEGCRESPALCSSTTMPDLPGRCVGRPPGVDPLCRCQGQLYLRPASVSRSLPAQLLAQRAPGEPGGPVAAGFPCPAADRVALLGPAGPGCGPGESGGRAV